MRLLVFLSLAKSYVKMAILFFITHILLSLKAKQGTIIPHNMEHVV